MIPLEDRLVDELQAQAGTVPDVPGLSGRVIEAAHRHRRRQVAGGVLVGVVLALVGGLAVTRGSTSTHPLLEPPAHSTTSPTSTDPPDALRRLPEGLPPGVAWAVGRVVHLDGGNDVRLPQGMAVRDLQQSALGLVVVADRAEGDRVVLLVTPAGDVTVLDEGAPTALAIDPTGTYAAWGSAHDAAAQERLTVMDLRTRSVVQSVDVAQPAGVHAWVPGTGPIFSYLVDPGGAPVLLDVTTGELRPTWQGSGEGGEPTFLAYSAATRTLALRSSRGCLLTLQDGRTTPRGAAGCVLASTPAAYSPEGERLAAVSMTGELVVVHGSEVEDANRLGSGLGVRQQVWEGGARRLVTVEDVFTGTAHVLRCVGSGMCERAYDAAPGELVVVAR
jgi:hypothetical protein